MPTAEDFEECRALRHAWKRLKTETTEDPFEGQVRVLHLRCTRCTMKRTDEFDGAGDLVARAYGIPDGYSRRAADEHPTLQELRLRLTDRMLKENITDAS